MSLEELSSASLVEPSSATASKRRPKTVASSAPTSRAESKNACHFFSSSRRLSTLTAFFVRAGDFWTPDLVGCDDTFLLSVELPELPVLGGDFMVSEKKVVECSRVGVERA